MTLLIDGHPPTEDDLRYLATVNYGVYTSFRVESRGARGLDLHIERLNANSVEMFGFPPYEEWLIDCMRMANAKRQDGWLQIRLFSPEIYARLPSERVQPKIFIIGSDPPPPLAETVRVQVQTYLRDAAHIKHTATFPLIRARRIARDAGFDDALFVDADGLISEGSLWNVGFFAGDAVIWPQAPMLSGVTQALISRGLSDVGMTETHRPVRLADLAAFDGAFLCNSATPACPITAIGDHAFAVDPDRIERLRTAWASNPLQAI